MSSLWNALLCKDWPDKSSMNIHQITTIHAKIVLAEEEDYVLLFFGVLLTDSMKMLSL